MTDDEHDAVIQALYLSHRHEIGKLQLQLALYRGVIVDAGLEPPDRSAEELLELVHRCGTVVIAAHDVMDLLGSAHELLADLPWRNITPKEGALINAS